MSEDRDIHNAMKTLLDTHGLKLMKVTNTLTNMGKTAELVLAQQLKSECEHNFQYQGTVAWHDGRLPGSGAEHRYYAERFFCTRCLAFRYTDKRVEGSSYRELNYGAILLAEDPT